MARKPRGLTEEETALWDQVRRSATPIRPDSPFTPPDLAKRPVSKKQTPREPIAPFELGARQPATQTSTVLAPDIGRQLTASPPAMDARKYKQMRRGKVAPDARIDLHGMTIAQAHPRLIGFIQQAYGNGHRLVLVITGKGKDRDDDGPIPVRHGVLRHQVPHWLHSAPLSSIVLQVSQAHLKHGGSGAYYVFLRRPR